MTISNSSHSIKRASIHFEISGFSLLFGCPKCVLKLTVLFTRITNCKLFKRYPLLILLSTQIWGKLLGWKLSIKSPYKWYDNQLRFLLGFIARISLYFLYYISKFCLANWSSWWETHLPSLTVVSMTFEVATPSVMETFSVVTSTSIHVSTTQVHLIGLFFLLLPELANCLMFVPPSTIFFKDI